MLVHLLALVVGLGSFALYMSAFLFPEVHRKNDLIWSGVGLFYALVLWFCAGQIKGAVLLGQTASVALLGWLGWQTLRLRRVTTPLDQQTLPSASPQDITQRAVDQVKSAAQNFSIADTATAIAGVASSAVETMTQGKSQPQTPAPSEPAATLAAEETSEVATAPEPVSSPKAEEETAIAASVPESPAPEPLSQTTEMPDEIYVEYEEAVAPRSKARSKPQGSEVPDPPQAPRSVQRYRGENKLKVLKDWLFEVVSSSRKPKTRRPVIEIPPREPSMPPRAAVNQVAEVLEPELVEEPDTTQFGESPAVEVSADQTEEVWDEDWETDSQTSNEAVLEPRVQPEETESTLPMTEVAAAEIEPQVEAQEAASPEGDRVAVSDAIASQIADAAAEIIEEEQAELPDTEDVTELEVETVTEASAEDQAPAEDYIDIHEPLTEEPAALTQEAQPESEVDEAAEEAQAEASSEPGVEEGTAAESVEPTVDESLDREDIAADDVADAYPEADDDTADLTGIETAELIEVTADEIADTAVIEATELTEVSAVDTYEIEPDVLADLSPTEVLDDTADLTGIEATEPTGATTEEIADTAVTETEELPEASAIDTYEIEPNVLADLSPEIEADLQAESAAEPSEDAFTSEADHPLLRRPNPPSPDLIQAAQPKPPADDPELSDRSEAADELQ